ncbi:MAG TPA: carboxypeptidase-like regulatory domain-containing protein [Terriglobales bacterium]|nr:carboxypeptidase-like regulatory domain-containing protein [Terriglobales bacterium]
MTKQICVFMLMFCAVAFAQQKNISQLLPGSGNVSLPLEEYNHLVELASKPAKNPEVPPVNYSVKHANLKLRVENDAVSGTVVLDGEVFKKGMARVPLASGVTILDVREQSKGVPLTPENGTQVAILAGPAEFSINENVALPLQVDAGRASFIFPVPAAGGVQMSLVVPGEHTGVNISPGLITNRTSENGHTTIEATLPPGQTITAWWATREAVAPVVPREVRFLSNIKTLVSVGEAELRLAALADINVVQGDPTQFEMEIPAGYEVTGVTGATMESSEKQGNTLILKVNAPGQRNHQFLISLERSITESKSGVPFLSFKNAQREIGEVLVEGSGTMELTATEGGSLKRMDVKEANAYLRGLANFPPQAAFRYHRQPNEVPNLSLEWVRFPDSSVLAAVADSAQVTTMVTSEGRTLTEIKLLVKNQAQPFLKVSLPAGASILSADVEGEKVKPVTAPDGNRVPLLRAGFRPSGPYTVSFVFLNAGTPFAKKGGSELVLPSMDIPIGIVHWEVFLPEQYKVTDFHGNAISATLVPPAFQELAGVISYDGNIGNINGAAIFGLPASKDLMAFPLAPGQLGGVIEDPSGAIISNATVTVTNTDTGFSTSATTDSEGRWIVSNLSSGKVKINANASGFKGLTRDAIYNANRPAHVSLGLSVGNVSETVTVEAEALSINGRNFKELSTMQAGVAQAASANVVSLQRRVAGVLPVAIDVPRAGTSFQFVRPLVLGEETKVAFNYKSRG